MRMGESVPVQEGAAVLLRCARCKVAVKSGEIHKCQQEEVANESNEARQNGSTEE